MNIRFIRVLGINSHDPSLVAVADNHRVRWDPKRDWDCDCLTPEDAYECAHITVIRDMTDPRVYERRKRNAHATVHEVR